MAAALAATCSGVSRTGGFTRIGALDARAGGVGGATGFDRGKDTVPAMVSPDPADPGSTKTFLSAWGREVIANRPNFLSLLTGFPLAIQLRMNEFFNFTHNLTFVPGPPLIHG
jgi:hypothetical protein